MNSPHPALFRTIPKDDYFELFNKGELDVKKVLALLKYKKEDVSAAISIPVGSVRYDEKMPQELKERVIEWAVALNLVAGFFKDQEKTVLWFFMPNPLLGEMSPRDMIRVGRFKKLIKFIQTALDENHR